MRVHAREGADLYKSPEAVKLPPLERLTQFRNLILRARTSKVPIGEATSEVNLIIVL